MADENINKGKNEFWDSLTQGIRERMSSAVFFNYIWFWVIFNWEFVYFTLYPESAGLVNNQLFIAQVSGIASFEWKLPLVWAIMLGIITPFLNMIFKSIRFYAYLWTLYFRPKAAGLFMLPSDEHARLYYKLNSLEKDYQNAIAEYKAKNDLVPDLMDLRKKHEPFFDETFNQLDLKGKYLTESIPYFHQLFTSGDAEIEGKINKSGEQFKGLSISKDFLKLDGQNPLRIVSWYKMNDKSTFILTYGTQTNPNRMTAFELKNKGGKYLFVVIESYLYYNSGQPHETVTFFVGTINQ